MQKTNEFKWKPEEVLLDIVPDKSGKYGKLGGLIEGYGGGKTINSNKIHISDLLTKHNTPESILQWTFGGVTLHELLYHISPNQDLDEGATKMRIFYNIRTRTKSRMGRLHARGNNINNRIKRTDID